MSGEPDSRDLGRRHLAGKRLDAIGRVRPAKIDSSSDDARDSRGNPIRFRKDMDGVRRLLEEVQRAEEERRRDVSTMRREEREIRDQAEVQAIMREDPVCRLGLSEDGTPYVARMSFGLEELPLPPLRQERRKLDIIRRNDRVCFEMDLFGR